MKHKKTVLDLEIRKHLYNYILKNPGLHIRELSRKINIPKTTLRYHLRFLIKEGLICVKKEGRYNRIFVLEKIGAKEKELLNLLRQEIPCKILLYIYSFLICSQIELSKELQKSPTTIEFHLKKLIDMDIIQPISIEKGFIHRYKESSLINGRNPIKNEIIYGMKSTDITLKIHKLIMKYGNSLPDKKLTSIIVKYVQELDMSRKLPNLINYYKVAVDDVCNVVYDVFPHPYHI